MWVSVSKTISFVATDELAEILEEEAQRRMTSVSSAAQQLLAERVRELDRGEDRESTSDSGESAETGPDGGSELADEDGTEESGSDPSENGTEPEYPVLEDHADMWYEATGDEYDYGLHVPEGTDHHRAGRVSYYKTKRGMAEALREIVE